MMKTCNLWLIAVHAVVIFFIIGSSHTVSGKCAGQWAIHACGGGQGKRSEELKNDFSSNLQLLQEPSINREAPPPVDQRIAQEADRYDDSALLPAYPDADVSDWMNTERGRSELMELLTSSNNRSFQDNRRRRLALRMLLQRLRTLQKDAADDRK